MIVTTSYNPHGYTDEQTGAIGDAIQDCIGAAIDHGLRLNLVTLATVQEHQRGLLNVTVHGTDSDGNECDSFVLIDADGLVLDVPTVGRRYQ